MANEANILIKVSRDEQKKVKLEATARGNSIKWLIARALENYLGYEIITVNQKPKQL